ncbi:hypothetical protein JW935_17820 [candidate division KSB1 bacterium]|nr:hypothetical protein [candidate division KSB1 bacterium]
MLKPFYIAMIVLLLIINPGFSQGEINLAILDLEGFGITETEAKALSERLRYELLQIGKYKILERGKMTEILDEQGFQQTGCTSNECAIQVGKLLNVQYMLSGSISKVGRTFSTNIRMIEVETGLIVKSAVYDKVGEIDDLLINGMKQVAEKLCAEKEEKPVMPKPVLGTVRILSYPAGGEIFIDGKPLQSNDRIVTTPFTLTGQNAGTLKIGVRSGDLFQEQLFTVRKEQVTVAEFHFMQESIPEPDDRQKPKDLPEVKMTPTADWNRCIPQLMQRLNTLYTSPESFYHLPWNPALDAGTERISFTSYFIQQNYDYDYSYIRMDEDSYGNLVKSRRYNNTYENKSYLLINSLVVRPSSFFTLGLNYSFSNFEHNQTKRNRYYYESGENRQFRLSTSEYDHQFFSLCLTYSKNSMFKFGSRMNYFSKSYGYDRSDEEYTDIENYKYNKLCFDLGIQFYLKNNAVFDIYLLELGKKSHFTTSGTEIYLEDDGTIETFQWSTEQTLESPLYLAIDVNTNIFQSKIWLLSGIKLNLSDEKLISKYENQESFSTSSGLLYTIGFYGQLGYFWPSVHYLRHTETVNWNNDYENKSENNTISAGLNLVLGKIILSYNCSIIGEEEKIPEYDNSLEHSIEKDYIRHNMFLGYHF